MMQACLCSASRSRTTSRSRPSASARSGPTSRTSGTRAGCTASSAGGRCGSRRRRAASSSSRSTTRSVPRCRKLLGVPFDLDAFYRWRDRPGRAAISSRSSRASGRRSRPDPFESLVTSITAQQVSLFAAFAIRNRMIERYGVRGEHAYSFPTREAMAGARRGRALRARVLAPQGGVRRRARAVGSRPRRARRASRRRGQGADHRRARSRRVDRRLVPRPPPRPAARLGAGRPRRAQGGRLFLW